MIRSIALFSLLLPGLSVAQVSSLSLEIAGTGEATVSADDCAAVVQVSWKVALQGVPCSDLSFWITEGECGEAAGASDRKLPSVVQSSYLTQPSGTFSITVQELPTFMGATAPVCGVSGLEKQNKVCGAFSWAGFSCDQSKTVSKPSNPPIITYDSLAPAAPVLLELTSQDQSLTARFSAPSDAVQVHFEVRAEGSANFVSNASVSADLITARLSGLVNDVAYEVRALSEDAAGNRSEPSQALSEVPVRTEGFFSIYRNAGGTGQGGCSSVGGSALGLFCALAALRLVSRRRRS